MLGNVFKRVVDTSKEVSRLAVTTPLAVLSEGTNGFDRKLDEADDVMANICERVKDTCDEVFE